MMAVGSMGAVIGRISAIEARLGVRPTAPATSSTTGSTSAGVGTVSPGSNAAMMLDDGFGGDDFGRLLEHAERSTGPMINTGLPGLPGHSGATASLRNGPAPFATSAPAWSQAAPVTSRVGTTSHDIAPAGQVAGGSGVLPPGTPFGHLFEQAGATWGIPPQVLAAVGFVESSFRTDVVSPAGAQGLMQFMPATSASMGVDPWDPASAIDGAARLLREMQDRFGSLDVALGAYNVGPGTIARAGGGIVPGSQSEKYLNAVTSAMEKYS